MESRGGRWGLTVTRKEKVADRYKSREGNRLVEGSGRR